MAKKKFASAKHVHEQINRARARIASEKVLKAKRLAADRAVVTHEVEVHGELPAELAAIPIGSETSEFEFAEKDVEPIENIDLDGAPPKRGWFLTLLLGNKI